MYCSRCAAQISEDLNFCSTCGERVNKNDIVEEKKVRNSVLDTVATTATILGVGGMLFLVGLVAVLLDKTVPMQIVIIIAAMYLAAWFGIMYRLVNQISRIVEADLDERKVRATAAAPLVQLPPRVTAQLESHQQEPASVTEQTTRGLEPAPVVRNPLTR